MLINKKMTIMREYKVDTKIQKFWRGEKLEIEKCMLQLKNFSQHGGLTGSYRLVHLLVKQSFQDAQQ